MNAECRSKLSGAAIYILVCFTVVLLALFGGVMTQYSAGMLGAIFHGIPLGDGCLMGFKEGDLKIQQISLIIVVLERITNLN